MGRFGCGGDENSRPGHFLQVGDAMLKVRSGEKRARDAASVAAVRLCLKAGQCDSTAVMHKPNDRFESLFVFR